jgi:phospholipid/cholesterol/gamma-HCH transport system substrate-binding protein
VIGRRRKGGRRHEQRKPVVFGAVTLAILGVAVFFGFTKSNPFDDPYEVKAAFRTVNNLAPRSPVRIAGVNVGRVTRIEPLGDGTRGAVVTMEIEEAGLPLHEDATFKVRPRIFLEGNYFVDVRPGTPSSPHLDEGEMVPVQQTAAPVQFGDFLQTLQSDTREDLQTVLQEYGRAFDSDGGDAYHRSQRYWRPAFENSAVVNDATRGIREHDLSEYLGGAARVAAGLDRDPERLQSLITSFARTADAFADEQAQLSAAIRQLPRTLGTGRRALGVLRSAFPPLRRLVADMRPTLRSAPPALDAQLPLVRQLRGLVSRPELRGLVRDLRPVVPDLVELNRGGVALQEQQRLLSSCQNLVVNPWQNERIPDPNFRSEGPIYQEAARTFPGLAGESRSFDANGQYVRSLANNANYAYLLGGDRFYLTGAPLQGINPPPAPEPRYRPDVPCETQERPDLRTQAAPPPRAVRINHNAPGAAERRRQANAVALDWLRDNLRESGLDRVLQVGEQPLRRSQLDDVRRTLGAEAAPR